ncbi:hypothetical protein D3C81_864650 [compost metagenome]
MPIRSRNKRLIFWSRIQHLFEIRHVLLNQILQRDNNSVFSQLQKVIIRIACIEHGIREIAARDREVSFLYKYVIGVVLPVNMDACLLFQSLVNQLLIRVCRSKRRALCQEIQCDFAIRGATASFR